MFRVQCNFDDSTRYLCSPDCPIVVLPESRENVKVRNPTHNTLLHLPHLPPSYPPSFFIKPARHPTLQAHLLHTAHILIITQLLVCSLSTILRINLSPATTTTSSNANNLPHIASLFARCRHTSSDRALDVTTAA